MKGGKEVRDLLELRKKLKVSQKKISEIIEVSQAQVSRIEKGTTELSLAQFGMLCKALKLTNEDQQDLINRAISQAKPKRIRKSKDQD
jgi:predicted transcriptional regulator